MNIERNLALFAADFGFAAVGSHPAVLSLGNERGWANTVISVALAYPAPLMQSPDCSTGTIAAFAAGPDYHRVLRNRMLRFIEIMQKTYPGLYEIHVDNPNFPERRMAELSGLGRTGLNNCLFIENYGSYTVLGEILTDRSFVQSTPALSLCNNCGLCAKSCPTGALMADGTFDRALCISHLTQTRGLIAPELMQKMGRNLYGCDICQKVCPLNSNVRVPDTEMPATCYPGFTQDLENAMLITTGDWHKQASGSSVGWIGRNTWRRNAIIAATNSRNMQLLPVISSLREDASPVVAQTATWAQERMCYMLT